MNDDRRDGRPGRSDAPRASRNPGAGEQRHDAADDTRRWGYDPAEDIGARGVAQDERQFGGDRGYGGYGGDRRGEADDPRAPRGRYERFAGERGPQGLGWHGGGEDAPSGRVPSHDRPGVDRGTPGDRPGAAGRSYEATAFTTRQGGHLAGRQRDAGDSGYGTARGDARSRPSADARPRGGPDRGGPAFDDRNGGPGPRDDARRPGLAGQSPYGPGDWGGRDGRADLGDADDPAVRDARHGDEPMGEGGYGGPTGLLGMGTQGPWGPGAGRGGRSHVVRQGGVGGYGGGYDDRGGLGDMGGFGGLAQQGDDAPLDDPNGPGHLAAGSGGSGDWQASGYGGSQRRGPTGGDAPYRPDPQFQSDRWPADQSPQRRFGAEGRGPTASPANASARFGGEHYGDEDPRARGPREPGRPGAGLSYGGWENSAPEPDRAGARPANRGPKGWQRSDDRVRDDVCERLSRAPRIDASDVEVTVKEGHVTLAGTVVDRPMKHAIEDLVDGVPGVKDIENRIKVMRPDVPRPPDAPPQPNRTVPQDSPTARDEAKGKTVRGTPDKSGYYG